jgi:hypothetical protein
MPIQRARVAVQVQTIVMNGLESSGERTDTAVLEDKRKEQLEWDLKYEESKLKIEAAKYALIKQKQDDESQSLIQKSEDANR